MWSLIYYAQMRVKRYVAGLHSVNYVALGVNAFFTLAHLVQTQIWYDGLAQEIGGPAIPAIGFAIGVERLVMLLPEEKSFSSHPDVFLAVLGKEAQARGFALAQEMRDAGIWVEFEYEEKSLKSQMRKADKMKSRYVIILGEEELKKNQGVIRNMATKDQEEVPLEEVVKRFKKD
jgi:histidyl-tRNA synthetase